MAKVAGLGFVAGLGGLAAAALAGACVRANEPTQVVRAALTAAPFIGPESRVDEPVYTDRYGDQRQAFAAVGGPGAIVAWENNTRPGFGVTSDLVWFVRLGTDGAPLDRLPIPITPASQATSQTTPAAAWSGDRALVVWAESVPGGTDVRGARVGTDGKVLDPNGLGIGLGGAAALNIRVLPAGDGWAVFWTDLSNTRVTRVGRDGAVATSGGKIVSVPASTTPWLFADAAPVTGGYLALLYSGATIGAIKVDASGAVLSTFATGVGTGTITEGAIGSNGTTAVALWIQASVTSGGTTTQMTVMARRLSDAGAWLDTAPAEARPAGNRVARPGVTWTGTSFLCAWNDGSVAPTRVTLPMRRMDPTGAFLDAQPIVPTSLTNGLVFSAQVVWLSAAPLVVIQKTIYTTENSGIGRIDTEDGVETRALDANLQPVGAAANPISVQANTEAPYRAVSIGSAALTVWQDDRSRAQRSPDGYGNADIYGARLAIDGVRLTQTVAPVATINHEANPAITWDGALAPIVYETGDGVTTATRALAHLLPSGAPDGKTPVSMKITEGLAEVQLLPNGTGLILAGLLNTGLSNTSGSFSPPRVHRLSAAGAELDPKPIAVALATASSPYFRASDLSTVLLGGTTLLVWQDTLQDNDGFDTDQTEVHGSLVTADGVSPTNAGRVIASGPDAQAHPALATDATSAAVLWIDRSTAGSRLQGARVDATLARLDAGDVTIADVAAPERLGPPALAWTGTAYVAAWTRTSGGTLAFDACLLGSDLRCQPGTQTSFPSTIAAISTPLSTALPTDAGATGPSAEGIVLPELVWTDAGGVLLYRRHDTDPLVDQDRLFARPVVVAETQPPEFDAGAVSPPDAAADATGGDATGGGSGGAGSGGAGGGVGPAGTAGQAGGAGAGGSGAGGGVGAKGGSGCSCTTGWCDVHASWYTFISLGIALALQRRRRLIRRSTGCSLAVSPTVIVEVRD